MQRSPYQDSCTDTFASKREVGRDRAVVRDDRGSGGVAGERKVGAADDVVEIAAGAPGRVRRGRGRREFAVGAVAEGLHGGAGGGAVEIAHGDPCGIFAQHVRDRVQLLHLGRCAEAQVKAGDAQGDGAFHIDDQATASRNPARQFHVADKMQGPAAEHRIAVAGNAGDDAVFLYHDVGMTRQRGDRFDLRAIARAPAAQIDFL